MKPESNTERFESAAREINVATAARSLELAMDAVGHLFATLSGNELRDSVIRLVAALETEARRKTVLAIAIAQSNGIAADDPALASLIERVEQ